MEEKILDFQDVKERFEAERLANERARLEKRKITTKKPLSLIVPKCFIEEREYE